MMKNDEYSRKNYIDILENGTISKVMSHWKLEFTIKDKCNVEELKSKLVELGISILESTLYVADYSYSDVLTISTEDFDDEMYVKLHEFDHKFDGIEYMMFYHLQKYYHIMVNGESIPTYEKYKCEWLEMEAFMNILKEEDPEEYESMVNEK